jgi:hypothetical protein
MIAAVAMFAAAALFLARRPLRSILQ